MDWSAIGSGLLSIANNLLPLVASGVPGLGAVVKAAETTIGLIDKVKDTLSETDQAKLQATRDELEAAVMAHADRTIASLG